MSDTGSIVLVAAVLLYVLGGLAWRVLAPSVRVLLGKDDGPPIFASAGPIEGGAVQYEQIPDVTESPAWTSRHAPPSFYDALDVVLQVGEDLRRCPQCQSLAGGFGFGDWSINSGAVYAEISQACVECGHERTFFVNNACFVAFHAMGAWEQSATALALGQSMEGSETLDADLADLDEQAET